MKTHNSETTRAVLAGLQRQAWKELGRKPPSQAGKRAAAIDAADLGNDALGLSQDPALREAVRESFRQSIEQVDLPTPYEDPLQYSLLLATASAVEAAAQDVGEGVAFRPMLGSMPSGRINAMAIKVEEPDEVIIAFESGFFGFANLFSKIVAQALPFEPAGAGERAILMELDAIESHLESVARPLGERFVDVISAYIMRGNPYEAQQYFTDREHLVLAQYARNALEYFVMGHEYGHVLSGHLELGQHQLRALPKPRSAEVILNWDQEYEADASGFYLGLAAMLRSGAPPPFAIWGGELFFGCVEVIARAATTLELGSGCEAHLKSYTHPSPDDRRAHLHRIIRHQFGASNVMSSSAAVRFVLEFLWQHTEPFWIRMHEKGSRPLPIW